MKPAPSLPALFHKPLRNCHPSERDSGARQRRGFSPGAAVRHSQNARVQQGRGIVQNTLFFHFLGSAFPVSQNTLFFHSLQFIPPSSSSREELEKKVEFSRLNSGKNLRKQGSKFGGEIF